MHDQTFPALPQGIKRFSIEQLLIDLAPALGLRGNALHALLHMMKATRPSDWTSPDHEPVFFGSQEATASALGITRRALYNIEVKLEALGLVDRRVKGNGQRSSHGRCGIVFSKLIALFPDLARLAEQIIEDGKLRKHLKGQRSSSLRYMKARLRDTDPEDPAIRHIIEAFEAWPRADALARMDLETLSAHVEDAKALCMALDDIISLHEDSSGEPALNFRCHIQENNPKDLSVSCNANVDKSSAGKPAHSEYPAPEPAGSGDCGEKKCEAESEAHKAQILKSFTPERLFKLASPDMQTVIALESDGAAHPRTVHFFNAAYKMLAPLGINHSAWTAALDIMGPDSTWLAVFLIDANRDHPTAPVANPGGALRAMTKRHRQGKLNLAGSLIGLSRRKDL